MDQPTHDTETLIRGSSRWWNYLFLRLGLLSIFVNTVEDALAIAGRFFLLSFLVYTAAKSLLLLQNPTLAMPVWLDATMAVLQLAGLEGSVPGLGRRADLLKDRDKEAAAKIGWVMGAAQFMTVLAFGEIALHLLQVLPVQVLQWISALLLVIRGYVITRFLLELAKVENHAPRVISKAEYAEEQARSQHVAQQATEHLIAEAMEGIRREQQQHVEGFTRQYSQALAQLTTNQQEMETLLHTLHQQAPALEEATIVQAVIEHFEGAFQTAIAHLEAGISQAHSVPAASETRQLGTSQRPRPDKRGVSRGSETSKVGRSREGRGTGNTDTHTIIYALLDEDRSRQVTDLVRLTGLPKTTVWRIWSRYHEEDGTAETSQVIEAVSVVKLAPEQTRE